MGCFVVVDVRGRSAEEGSLTGAACCFARFTLSALANIRLSGSATLASEGFASLSACMRGSATDGNTHRTNAKSTTMAANDCKYSFFVIFTNYNTSLNYSYFCFSVGGDVAHVAGGAVVRRWRHCWRVVSGTLITSLAAQLSREPRDLLQGCCKGNAKN